MSLATTLISKVDSALNKTKVTDRVVYKRLLSRGGGDPLIGRSGSVTVTDTELQPQPAIFRAPVEITTGANRNSVSSYKIIASASSLSEADLRNKDMVFVMKSGGGDLLEELFVDSFIPSVIDGAVVAWKITARSKFRG